MVIYAFGDSRQGVILQLWRLRVRVRDLYFKILLRSLYKVFGIDKSSWGYSPAAGLDISGFCE